MTDSHKAALVTAGGILAHYSMPDFVGSKSLRFVGKTAVNSGLIAWFATEERDSLNDGARTVKEYLDGADADELKSAAGVVAGLTITSTFLTILAEKGIFKRAESKKAEGKRLPHTKQALVLAALGAGLTLIGDKVDAK